MKNLLNKWSIDEETKNWQKGIFVFDSSTLLNFYELSNATRQDIYRNIFPSLEDRLWITNQTEFEFLKHRDKVENRPDQLYQEIKEKHYPSKHLRLFIQQFDQLKVRTSKDTRHPYILPETFSGFNHALDILIKSQKSLEDALDKQIGERIQDHKEAVKNDQLLSFFQVTPAYNYQQLMEIVKEGEFRFRNKIPPGYADAKAKEELGISKYADLIIWKQIIELAKQVSKPILLVIDDLKEDWCIPMVDDKRKMLAPRIELIQEMLDVGGVPFWSYSSSQFLYKAKEILKTKIATGVIDEVKEVARMNRSVIEEAVFKWAAKRFGADETIWAANYWKSDVGVDIVQTVDGVAFGMKIRYLTGLERIKELMLQFEEIKEEENSGNGFELVVTIYVTEGLRIAKSVRRLINKNLREVAVYIGFINSQMEFIEVNDAENL